MTNRPSARRRFEAMWVIGCAVLLPASVLAQNAATPYPTMAPAEAYRMSSADEIALARSAAPAAISGDAEILVLGASGYETAVKGANGFVCLVERSWANVFGNSDFWNPKNRAPVCYNPPAARSVLPAYIARTRGVLAGVSVAKMEQRERTQPAASGIKPPEMGAMCYMLSQHGYLGDNVKGPWHPHLMFILPRTSAATWGAGVDHSPVTLLTPPGADPTIFLVPVATWADGTPDSTAAQ